jgi:hypothetical protein
MVGIRYADKPNTNYWVDEHSSRLMRIINCATIKGHAYYF